MCHRFREPFLESTMSALLNFSSKKTRITPARRRRRILINHSHFMHSTCRPTFDSISAATVCVRLCVYVCVGVCLFVCVYVLLRTTDTFVLLFQSVLNLNY